MMKPRQTDSLSPAFRRLRSQFVMARDIWSQIRDSPVPADRWLGNYFHRYRRKIGSRDRRFLAECIYSLFRNRTFIESWARVLKPGGDGIISVILSARLENLAAQNDCRRLMQLGDSKTVLLEKIEKYELPPGYEHRDEPAVLAVRYSFPEWLAEKWRVAFGRAQTRALLEQFQSRAPLIVRCNPLNSDRDRLLKRIARQGFKVRPAKYSPWGIVFDEHTGLFDREEFKDGLLEVQDQGSQLVCAVVDARPGEMVWDMCAGGGGKSLLLAALMKNKGRIVATDIRPRKLLDLKKRAKRAGVFNVFPADLDRMDEIKAAKGGFDRILVDAPCSGTGTFRRNPDAKWKITGEKIEELVRKQKDILKRAAGHLKTGGRLYYVTCSLERDENEEVFKEFLGIHPEMRAVYPEGTGTRSEPGTRLWPDSENDGFFIGVAEKYK